MPGESKNLSKTEVVKATGVIVDVVPYKFEFAIPA